MTTNKTISFLAIVVTLLGLIANVMGVSSCTSQQNTTLASCNSTFTACVNAGVTGMCECVTNRIECSNGLNCTEADVRGKTWFNDCESEGLCTCPTTRVEKFCAQILADSQTTFDECIAGAFPNATYCDCVKMQNATYVANVAACNNSNTDFSQKSIEISAAATIYCAGDQLTMCTPYEVKQFSTWSAEYGNCTDQYTNDTVIRVGPYCQCTRAVRNKFRSSTGSCLASLVLAIDTLDALYDCQTNINTTGVCNNAKFTECTSNSTTCQSAASGSVPGACACYTSYSNCLQANILCPGANAAQAVFHEACKATCPITTNCGPMGKTINFPTTAAANGTTAPTSPGGSPYTGTAGTGPDGSPLTTGTQDLGTYADGSPVTTTAGTGTNGDGASTTGGTGSTVGGTGSTVGATSAATQIVASGAALLLVAAINI
jgi:hypothetical protein